MKKVYKAKYSLNGVNYAGHYPGYSVEEVTKMLESMNEQIEVNSIEPVHPQIDQYKYILVAHNNQNYTDSYEEETLAIADTEKELVEAWENGGFKQYATGRNLEHYKIQKVPYIYSITAKF